MDAIERCEYNTDTMTCDIVGCGSLCNQCNNNQTACMADSEFCQWVPNSRDPSTNNGTCTPTSAISPLTTASPATPGQISPHTDQTTATTRDSTADPTSSPANTLAADPTTEPTINPSIEPTLEPTTIESTPDDEERVAEPEQIPTSKTLTEEETALTVTQNQDQTVLILTIVCVIMFVMCIACWYFAWKRVKLKEEKQAKTMRQSAVTIGGDEMMYFKKEKVDNNKVHNHVLHMHNLHKGVKSHSDGDTDYFTDLEVGEVNMNGNEKPMSKDIELQHSGDMMEDMDHSEDELEDEGDVVAFPITTRGISEGRQTSVREEIKERKVRKVTFGEEEEAVALPIVTRQDSDQEENMLKGRRKTTDHDDYEENNDGDV